MNRDQIHFDVNLISLIVYKCETINDNYRFVDKKPIKKFFGFIKTKKFTDSFFYTDFFCKFSKDDLIKMGYKVKDNKVYSKSRLIIHLTTGDKFVEIFDDPSDALERLDELKMVSGKTFEVI